MHLKLKIMVVQDASVDVHVSLKWCFLTFFPSLLLLISILHFAYVCMPTDYIQNIII